MRTVRVKIYQFSELTPKIQKKVLANNFDINTHDNWWINVYEDAELIRIKITAFDTESKYIIGNFIETPEDTIEAILQEERFEPETTLHKIAIKYKNILSKYSETDEEREEIIFRFREEVLKEYLNRLTEDYDYYTDEEQIKSTIEANEYEFLADGRMYSEPTQNPAS